MAANEALNDLDFTATRGPAAAALAAPRPAHRAAEVRRPKGAAGAIQVLRRRARGLRNAAQSPILMVEDDEDMRRLIHRVLDKMGLTVRIAAEAKAFQEALRRAPLPRLILLDVNLPGISGFKLLTALRRHPATREIPVLLVTGRDDDQDLVHGLALGADGYLSKPFHIDALRALVAQLLEAPV